MVMVSIKITSTISKVIKVTDLQFAKAMEKLTF